MQYTGCNITLNQVALVPLDAFLGIQIFNRISEGLTYGYFDMTDRTGDLFALFEHIHVGATVDIEVVNQNDEEQKRPFPTYYVLKIENDFNVDYCWAGNIRVWFGHPWFLYKDMKNHAYKPKNIGEHIKDILRNKDRGIDFIVDKPSPPPRTKFPDLYHDDMDTNFDKTDDNGKLGRFKIAESDWDFIRNKLLPYTAISRQPAHFYCDDISGLFYLKSFRTLFRQKPKILYHDSCAEYQEDIIKSCNTHSISLETGHRVIQDAHIVINNFPLIKEIFPSFYIENIENNTFLSGNKKLSLQLRPSNGPSFGNALPIDDLLVTKLNGTSSKVIHNRQLVDALFLLFQSSKYIDEMFTLDITSFFNGSVVTIGNTAELFACRTEIAGEKKNNWLGGKWVISELIHHSSRQNPRVILSTARLIRPAFIGSERSTSLQSFNMLYKSG